MLHSSFGRRELCIFGLFFQICPSTTPALSFHLEVMRKTRSGISQQVSDKVMVTFRDVAACFSDEEWKLLHEWQKELYRNVMKEIHQALISLGYQILNPDMLLRMYKGGETYTRDPQHSEKREDPDDPSSFRHPAVNPDMLLRIKHEEAPYCRDLHSAEEAGIQKGPSTVRHPAVNPDILLRIKHEEAPYCRDPHSAEEAGIRKGPSTGDVLKREENLCVNDSSAPEAKKSSGGLCAGQEEGSALVNPNIVIKKEESSSCLMDHRGVAGELRSTDPNPAGHDVISFVIGEEDDNYSVAHPASEKREGSTTPTAGDQSMTRYSAKCMEKAPSNSVSGQSTAHVFQRSEKGRILRSQLWSETIQEVGEERITAFKSGFSNVTQTYVYERTPKVDGSDTYNDCESKLQNQNLLTCQPNTMLNSRPYACTECEQSFTLKGDLHQHHTVHLGERPCASIDPEPSISVKVNLNMYQRKHEGVTNPLVTSYVCTECKETFSHKGSLMRHQKAHSGVAYACSECEKTFTRKESLTAHKTTHTDQKPYQCTECEKSFKRKKGIIAHKRTHTGEKPYQCTKCGKSFSVKGNLNTHERTHTGQKTYQCTICEKHFSSKMSLTLHVRTHTGEKPYQCTDCGKSFSHKGNLTTHERKHTGQKPYKCTECEKCFTRKINLTLHLRTHMGEKLAHHNQ